MCGENTCSNCSGTEKCASGKCSCSAGGVVKNVPETLRTGDGEVVFRSDAFEMPRARFDVEKYGSGMTFLAERLPGWRIAFEPRAANPNDIDADGKTGERSGIFSGRVSAVDAGGKEVVSVDMEDVEVETFLSGSCIILGILRELFPEGVR